MTKAEKDMLLARFFELKLKIDHYPELASEIKSVLRYNNAINVVTFVDGHISPPFGRSDNDNNHLRELSRFYPHYYLLLLDIQGYEHMLHRLEDMDVINEESGIGLLLMIHQMIYARSHYQSAGHFRKGDYFFTYSGHKPPLSSKIPELAAHHMVWLDERLMYLGKLSRYNFIEVFYVMSEIFFRLLDTAPFERGNMVVAFGMADYVLVRMGLPYNLIDFGKRGEFEAILKNSDIDNLSEITNFLMRSYMKTLPLIEDFVRQYEVTAEAVKQSAK